MNITDLIGVGKAFEPPFRVKNNTVHGVSEIWDRHGNIAIMMTRDNDVEIALADHICDLLNKEHGDGGNQRYQLLSKCCDVVRNTNLSDDIKEHLINTFMRL